MADKYITKGISIWHGNFNAQGAQTPGAFGHTMTEEEIAFGESLAGGAAGTAGTLIPDIQEFGDLGTGASAERDQIEVTTLADDKHVYTDGLLADDSEKDSIDFKFLYTPEAYKTFLDIIDMEKTNGYKSRYYVVIPKLAGGYNKFTILGTSTVKLDGATYNAALTITLTVTPKEEIDFDDVAA